MDPSQPPEDQPSSSSTDYTPGPPGDKIEPGGCLSLFVGAIAGFPAFLFGGWVVMALAKGSETIGGAYLIISGFIALWLALKPNFRGLALGIFLGIGAVLLLIAACSGVRIGG